MKSPLITPQAIRFSLATGLALNAIVFLYYWTHSGHYGDVALDAPQYLVHVCIATVAVFQSIMVLRIGNRSQKLMAILLLLLPALVIISFAVWAISNW
jgi:hypothetical protein